MPEMQQITGMSQKKRFGHKGMAPSPAQAFAAIRLTSKITTGTRMPHQVYHGLYKAA
jgi:hypothetical protein